MGQFPNHSQKHPKKHVNWIFRWIDGIFWTALLRHRRRPPPFVRGSGSTRCKTRTPAPRHMDPCFEGSQSMSSQSTRSRYIYIYHILYHDIYIPPNYHPSIDGFSLEKSMYKRYPASCSIPIDGASPNPTQCWDDWLRSSELCWTPRWTEQGRSSCGQRKKCWSNKKPSKILEVLVGK